MAEGESGQDRTEQPSQKRLDEARKRGQVPRSRDLSTAAMVLVAGLTLQLLGSGLAARFGDLMRAGLSLSRAQALDESRMMPQVLSLAAQGLAACAPILGVTVLAALLSPLAIGGWNVSLEALAPDITRLNPLNGIKNMFSARGATELLKSFLKFLVVAAVAVLYMHSRAAELLHLGAEPVRAAIAHAMSLTGSAFMQLSGALALIAAIDVPWQLHQHTEKLKMTRQELRDEHKDSDGSPEVKRKIRRMQQEFARRRMIQQVPTADVVVVNPTHYAVALRYDERRMGAPMVVAKGVDEVAAKIREVATENQVPILEAPPLARTLFRVVDLEAEVPASLYQAVAQVLTWVYQLRMARKAGGTPPAPPPIQPDIEEIRH